MSDQTIRRTLTLLLPLLLLLFSWSCASSSVPSSPPASSPTSTPESSSTPPGPPLTTDSSKPPTSQPAQNPPQIPQPDAPPAPRPEAVSLTGVQLSAPPLSADVQKKRDDELAAAQSEYDKNPSSADAMIWLGRRLAYLGRFQDAIAVFSRGIETFPDDARFYRHRGHRHITLRNFGRAIADLAEGRRLMKGKKDQIEPDGLPNARNIPTTSLQSNLCYHLGVAYYLRGDFEGALKTLRPCMKVSRSPDRLVSTSNWLYMTLRRLGRQDEATAILEPITMDMDVIENSSYHKLLLMYAGEIAPEELLREKGGGNDPATIGYGVGNWYMYNGQAKKAEETFRAVLKGSRWDAFGYIASEAELARK
ncbi:MAG TPA: tetratricopeptide repeat protein [Thermoanaerobaculia bacterium]|nr:tetratricopeptide repeat protein [Thermoanaerobaculia bacterium]